MLKFQVFFRTLHPRKLTASPENRWLEYEFPCGEGSPHSCYVSFGEATRNYTPTDEAKHGFHPRMLQHGSKKCKHDLEKESQLVLGKELRSWGI